MISDNDSSIPQLQARLLVISCGILVRMLLILSLASPSQASAQFFIVPLLAEQVHGALTSIRSPANNTMHSFTSIVVTSPNTMIYFDHGEDSYKADIVNQVQSTFGTWSDNNFLNGMPPGFVTDVLTAGDVISLMNDMPLSRNAANIFFNGGDKWGGTKALEVTRTLWTLPHRDTVVAGAAGVYGIDTFGTTFTMPIGEKIRTYDMFKYTNLLVSILQDNTTTQTD